MVQPAHEDSSVPGGETLTRRGWLRRAGRWTRGVACLSLPAAGGLVACSDAADRRHDGPDGPRAEPVRQPVRVAWVFSSGGPRGFVHVGVLQALAELGLKPDLIVGASAGALAGSLFAAGWSGSALRERALQLQPWQLGRLAWGTDERFSALGLADWVNEQLQGRGLHQLAVPVAVAAWNRSRAQLTAFTAGNAGLAVAASCAIEGQFAPLRLGDDRFVDADLHQPLPVRLALSLGAQRVLAVDASAHEWKAPAGTERWREGDLRKRALTQPDAQLADLLLHPDIGYYASISRGYRERVIDAGYQDTLRQGQALRALHA
ncbi:MAG: patatin-like phospholipase family protein [Rubrivivax sp.]